MVEMRDGLSLATDVYLPDADGPFATMMIRLPYGKTVDYCGIPEIAAHWNRKGYAFVGQDCRGTYGSEGVFDPAHPDQRGRGRPRHGRLDRRAAVVVRRRWR